MAMGSFSSSLLGSLVRRSMRCSSLPGPGIAVKETMGSAAQVHRLRSRRNAQFYTGGRRKSPVAAAAFAAGSSRCLHSMGARRFHDLRDVVLEHADGASATLSVVVFSVIAGILHLMQDTDEAQKEDTATKTNPYFHSHLLMEDLIRERASYNKTMPDEKTVVREYMEDDQAMRARFEEWMKEYGRTYKDEVEKARRFKIFKSFARFTDASNADSAKAGHSARFGLNEFSDWNKEEVAPMHGTPWRDGGYFKMVLSYLAPQGIWHQVDMDYKAAAASSLQW